MNSGSRGKEVVRKPSPPAPEHVEATIADDGAGGGSTSPGSDYALISPLAKAPRKRAAANARGKSITKEKEACAGNEDPTGTATALTALPAKNISNNEIVFVNIERANNM
jgi:hypothetical protein